MSNYEPCVNSAGATESSLLDEAALTESTYGDSRSLKMRQQLQADMADLAWTPPDVSLFTEGGSFFGTYGDSRSERAQRAFELAWRTWRGRHPT